MPAKCARRDFGKQMGFVHRTRLVALIEPTTLGTRNRRRAGPARAPPAWSRNCRVKTIRPTVALPPPCKTREMLALPRRPVPLHHRLVGNRLRGGQAPGNPAAR